MVNLDEINNPRQNAKRDNRSFSATQLSPNRSHSDIPPDELIGSLANALENKRARQVSEWESLGAKSVQASIATYR